MLRLNRTTILAFTAGALAASTGWFWFANGDLLSQAAQANPTIPSAALFGATQPVPDDGKLRIICFGAHPDDCELKAAGVAALWAKQGHHVKFVSVTNGDVGHWQQAGGPLAH